MGRASVKQVVDSSQAVENSYSYEAFGQATVGQSDVANPYLFVGGYGVQWESTPSLYFMQARYYGPSVGRFLSEDPYGGSPQDPMSLHRYLYCGNGPVSRTDVAGADGCPVYPAGHPFYWASGSWLWDRAYWRAQFAHDWAEIRDWTCHAGSYAICMLSCVFAGYAYVPCDSAFGCWWNVVDQLPSIWFSGSVNLLQVLLPWALPRAGCVAAAEVVGHLSLPVTLLIAVFVIPGCDDKCREWLD